MTDFEGELGNRLKSSPYRPMILFGICLLEEEFFDRKRRDETKEDFLKRIKEYFNEFFIAERCKGVYYISILPLKQRLTQSDVNTNLCYDQQCWRKVLKELGIPVHDPEIMII